MLLKNFQGRAVKVILHKRQNNTEGTVKGTEITSSKQKEYVFSKLSDTRDFRSPDVPLTFLVSSFIGKHII